MKETRAVSPLQVAQTEAGEVMPRGQEQGDPEVEVTQGSRLAQIIEWLEGGDSGGDCMIVLDGASELHSSSRICRLLHALCINGCRRKLCCKQSRQPKCYCFWMQSATRRRT